jgi:threonine aldolase
MTKAPRRLIDLRSDAVSKPTAGMLDAMLAAAVGDDVFGDDPSVGELESYSAGLLGKEAALFFPSGVMSNQVALLALGAAGREFVCNEFLHVWYHEQGGPAYLAGAMPVMAPHANGIMTAEGVAATLRSHPALRIAVVENTVNKGAGCYYTLAGLQALQRAFRESGIKSHLDGARLFNALAETGDAPAAAAACFDTVSFCLSKGLGAPAGTVLAGPREIIINARRIRNKMGGGMRQAGFLAAAGLYALKNHRERLPEDHAHARRLADALAQCRYVESVQPVHTNLVLFKLRETVKQDAYLDVLKRNGVLAVPFGERIVRLATHLGISGGDTEEAAGILESLNTAL